MPQINQFVCVNVIFHFVQYLTHQSKFDRPDEISPDDRQYRWKQRPLDLSVSQALANQQPIPNR